MSHKLTRREHIEEWFVRYSDDIYKFLVYYTRNRDVEDLVQEVFMKAIRGYEKYEGRAQPKTWLFSIARNTAIDHERKKRYLSWLPDTWLKQIKSPDGTPEEIVGKQEENQLLYAAVQRLKPSYREVVILRGIKGLSPSETAEILQWSESKVNTTLHRALKTLQRRLGKETDVDGVINRVI